MRNRRIALFTCAHLLNVLSCVQADEEPPAVEVDAPKKVGEGNPSFDYRVTVDNLGAFEKTLLVDAVIECEGRQIHVEVQIHKGLIQLGPDDPLHHVQDLSVNTSMLISHLQQQADFLRLRSTLKFLEARIADPTTNEGRDATLEGIRLDDERKSVERDLTDLRRCFQAGGLPGGMTVHLGVFVVYQDKDGANKRTEGAADVAVRSKDEKDQNQKKDK